jgi:transcriptional regulator with XRE-family HTH domain
VPIVTVAGEIKTWLGANVVVSPVVRRRRLAVELRRLRGLAGKSLDEAAAFLECSPAKVSRIETGQVGARIQDVRDLLDCYDVTGAARDALLDLVRQSRQRGWWNAYSDLLSDDLVTYIGLEDEATMIRTFETQLVPGLLQTEAYSRALMAIRRDTPLDDIDRGWQVRQTRQQILARDDPPQLRAVVDEAVLRRHVGGPEVMAGQYEHLVAMTGRPNVTVQILPFSAGAHPGASCPFTILGFDDPADPNGAYTETLTGRYYIDTAEELGRYVAEFEHLGSLALPPDESVAAVTALARTDPASGS